MYRVLDNFEKGEFLLPHTVQLPLAMVRVDPFTPMGTWLGEKITMII
jgi:hypothetical protein